jgi:surface polysaccharide O-acyltransferase-like enzyme
MSLEKDSRLYWIDNLRSFITVLVVAHHSSLAYTTFASFNKKAYASSTHPIVDPARWIGMDLFEDFNDIFFMSLMFLISGVFVISSLNKKGISIFISERFKRLFIPFLAGVILLMPIAYSSSYLLAHGQFSLGPFLIDFFKTQAWPVGPPWFIWVLFLFNLLVAMTYPYLKKPLQKTGVFFVSLNNKPFKLLLIWYLITWMAYIPILMATSPGQWTGIGPFDFQLSRILLYVSYFLLGSILGAVPLNSGLFSSQGLFVKKWYVWVLACGLAYSLLKLSEVPLTNWYETKQIALLPATLIYRSLWVLSCTLSCIAFLTLFKKVFNLVSPLSKSLSANAYGIYLFHFIFVLWIQFFLLQTALPAGQKFFITFILSLLLSYGLVLVLRKNNRIDRFL